LDPFEELTGDRLDGPAVLREPELPETAPVKKPVPRGHIADFSQEFWK
jgi:hypothetical protein